MILGLVVEGFFHCMIVDYNCRASAETKRVSWAVRQEKGNLLEENERVTGP